MSTPAPNTLWVTPSHPPRPAPPKAASVLPSLPMPLTVALARASSVAPQAHSSVYTTPRAASVAPPFAPPSGRSLSTSSPSVAELAARLNATSPNFPAAGPPNIPRKPNGLSHGLPLRPTWQNYSMPYAPPPRSHDTSSDHERDVDAFLAISTANSPTKSGSDLNSPGKTTSPQTTGGASSGAGPSSKSSPNEHPTGRKDKRKRSASPFEWQPEMIKEAEPDGFLELTSARTVDIEVAATGEPPTFLPIPLPSKRAKNRTGSRAILIPVDRLPVFPLPPLPPILDDELVKQVFTHSSLFEREFRLFEYPNNKPARHYEKLEHVGDSILGMVVTTWLHELQPNLTCGTATKLKAHLVSNATLSHISGMYNFPQRLNGDPQLLPLLRAQTDVRAAIVEAYIAALYFSYPPSTRATEGLGVIATWLREMFDPLYDFFLAFMRTEHQQHNSVMGAGVDGILELASSPEALDRLDQGSEGYALLLHMWGKQRERKVEWDAERYLTGAGELWRIRVYVDGYEMGEAIRAFTQRAKNAAALQAARKLGLAAEA